MKALIVYDSFFGNTEKIARAVGTALGLAKTDVVKVGELQSAQLAGLELLIVGSPTRAMQASDGIKAFLKGLPSNSLNGVKVAAFDTRMTVNEKTPGFLRLMVKLLGYAAEPMAKKLIRKGGMQVLAPAGFLVKDSEGPLQEGELERAAEWVKPLK
ncbi:MAG TPA: flavodoxin family protein [Leptolinea sp.]